MKRYFMYIQWFYWIQVFYLNYNYQYSCHLKQWRSYLGIIINQWSLRFFSYLFCIRRWIKWCVKSPVKVWDTKCSKHPSDTKRNANFLHFNFYCILADYISSSMKKMVLRYISAKVRLGERIFTWWCHLITFVFFARKCRYW